MKTIASPAKKRIGSHAGKLAVWFILLLCIFIAADTAYAAKDEAERVWELGEKAYNAGKYQEALSYYNKSLSLCGQNLECSASNLNGIGAVYEALDDDKKAFPFYEKALATAKKANNKDLIATNLFNTGAIHYRTFHQYEKAMSLFEESLALFRALKDEKSAAIVLFNMGKALKSLGRNDRALSVFNESLRMNRAANNEAGVAGILNQIGNVYESQGQYDKLLPYYQEALAINKRLNIQSEVATTLRNIGDAYCDLLERDKAVPYYQEALDIQKKNNLRSDMAITYNNMGALYKELDQYDKALAFYEASQKIARDLNDSATIATNMGNLGHVYATLGKTDKALSLYEESLKLDKRLNRPHRIAMTLNNIGMEYFRIGQYDKALQYLRESLSIDQKLGNPHNIAVRLNNIGAVYLRQKKYAEAETVLLERKDLGRRITKTRLIHAGLIEVYIATQRYDAALALLRELPPQWRDSRNRRMEYQTQYGLALKGKGSLKQSAHEFLQGVAIVEEIRRAVSDRSGFFAGGGYIGRLTPYRELMGVLADMSRAGERQDRSFDLYGKDAASSAFYFAEMAKARTLLETMAGAARTYDDAGLPPDIKRRETKILKELSVLNGRRESGYARDEATFNRLRQQEDLLGKELDTLIAEMRRIAPLYAAIQYPRPIPAEALPLEDDEVLIEFGVTQDAVMAFIVRKGGVKKIHRINITADELAGKAKAFMEPLASGNYNQFSIAAAEELYNLLLSEALKEAKETERLIIVSDGILGLLPFEALVVKRGKDAGDSLYAGDRWMITYAQSATALALTRLRKLPAAPKPLFAIGNPVYDKSDPRYDAYLQKMPAPVLAGSQKQYAYRGMTLQAKPGKAGDAMMWETVTYPPLPETEDEIRAIAKLFSVPIAPPDILLGVDASETNLRRTDLKTYRYIHFATHADLPGKIQGIKEPFIILGQVENKAGDDGFLTLSKVMELKLNADLVVLSACSTGRGNLMEGEGVANFSRAFQYAGARGVMVSLWEVASEAAVDYMKSFYSHMKSGRNKAEALRLARSEIKAKYPHPFFWSVFVLYGEI